MDPRKYVPRQWPTPFWEGSKLVGIELSANSSASAEWVGGGGPLELDASYAVASLSQPCCCSTQCGVGGWVAELFFFPVTGKSGENFPWFYSQNFIFPGFLFPVSFLAGSNFPISRIQLLNLLCLGPIVSKFQVRRRSKMT